MLQHLVHRVRVPLLSDNSVTTPSGSTPKAAVSRCKNKRKRKRKSLEPLSKKKQKNSKFRTLSQGQLKLNSTAPYRLRQQTVRLVPCGASYVRSTLRKSASWPKNIPCIPPTGAPAERVFSTCGNIGICHPVGQHQSQIR